MALLIFPIGVVLGWLVHPPRRAAVTTVGVGVVALAAYLLLGSTGVVVSPLETLVLLVGTPLAAVIAHRVSRWRLSRRSTHGSPHQTGHTP